MPKINELVKQYISVMIQQFFMDEIVSVNKVDVSKDLSYAKIWLASFSDVDKCVLRCNHNAKEFQRELAAKLVIRKTPKLHFVADKTGESVDKIERLLNQIKKEV